MDNLKTTILGGSPAIYMIIDGIANKDWGKVAGGVGLLLVSIFAKDAGKTKEN